MRYPWQTKQWQQLQSQIAEQRLPHALLLSGMEGLGKSAFSRALAEALLCQQPQASGDSCGQCSACHLLHAGTHPDLYYLAPEEANKAIKVDAIRDLCNRLALTSQLGGYKVAVIERADNMNINAANSLLKTLEEPSNNSVLILVSSRPQRLPITIRSRCQTIQFHLPGTQQAEAWLAEQALPGGAELLQLAHGAPLRAMSLADEDSLEQRQALMKALLGVAADQPITDFSTGLSKYTSENLLGWLYDWVSDLIKLHQTGVQAKLVHGEYAAQLKHLVAKSNLQGLYNYLDQVIALRRAQSIPLNAEMLWEDLLISWNRLIKRA